MEVKEMNMEEIETRLAEIRGLIDAEDADIDALTAEVDQLEERKKEIEAAAEARKALRAKVAAETNNVIKKFEETKPMEERIYTAESAEYRSAWLKNLAQRDGQKLFGELNEEEQRAFTFMTTNTGNLVPTTTLNRIIELVESQAPMYEDATKSGMTKGFSIPRHKSIDAGDAAVVDEGTANEDEQDTFDLLTLSGDEIKKHVVITRKMEWLSIDAFESWLVQHISKRIAVAKDTLIRTRLDAVATGIAAANVLTNKSYADEDVREILSKIKAAGAKVWYANSKTIWNGLAGIQDGENRPLFIASTMDSNPLVQGRIYGSAVKVDENLADNVAYVGVPKAILANDFESLFIHRAIEPKTLNTVITGYSLFDAGLENPLAFVKVTFTAS